MKEAQDYEPEQEALFKIEGPDEDECVWLVSGSGPSAVVVNPGTAPGGR